MTFSVLSPELYQFFGHGGAAIILARPPKETILDNMQRYVGKVQAPSNDPRWQQIDNAMRSYGYEANALIEILHMVQELFGFLSKSALEFVAAGLQVPPSKVY